MELGTGSHVVKGSYHPRNTEEWTMRGVLLWLIGIPIPIIILLYLFHVV